MGNEIVFSAFLVLGIWAVGAGAQTPDCPPATESTAAKNIADFKQFANSQDGKCLDAMFYAEPELSGGELKGVKFSDTSQMNLDAGQIDKVNQIYSNFFAQKDLNSAMAVLEKSKASLSLNQKFLLQSMMGQRFSDGYSSTAQQNKDLNSVFVNAANSGTNGGVCGDIHLLLSEISGRLGFQGSETTSVMWQQDLKSTAAGGHAISLFKDPTTGLYYAQNYSQIYSTGATTIQGAADVAGKVSGSFVGVQTIQTTPGVIHDYVPATAQWVQAQISGAARIKPGECFLHLAVGNHSQTVTAEYGNQAVHGFFTSTRQETPEGIYSLTAAGVSAQGSYSKAYSDSVIKNLNVSSEVFGGVMHLSAPTYGIGETLDRGKSTDVFTSVDVKGRADLSHFDQTSLKSEIKVQTYDLNFAGAGAGSKQKVSLSMPENSFMVGAEKKQGPLSISADRTLGVEPKYQGNSMATAEFGLKTKYDHVGVTYRVSPSGQTGKWYLNLDSDVYAMDGVDKATAYAVAQKTKAQYHANSGTFSIEGSYVTYVSNKSKDPFYQTPATKDVKIAYERVMQDVKVGAKVDFTKGQQIYPFGTFGDVSPEMANNSKRVTGMVYMQYTFGNRH